MAFFISEISKKKNNKKKTTTKKTKHEISRYEQKDIVAVRKSWKLCVKKKKKQIK